MLQKLENGNIDFGPEDVDVGREGAVDPAFQIQVVGRGLPRHVPGVHRYSASQFENSLRNSTFANSMKTSMFEIAIELEWK